MKKLSTLFKKDMNNLSRVINEVNPDNLWVLESGVPTRKYDGTACAIISGLLYKRYDVKEGKKIPKDAIECQKADEITGHHPHWVPCDKNNPENRYHFEAFDKLEKKQDGTYELCGPKINGNKENLNSHVLIPHGQDILNISDFSFENIKAFLEETNIEGIVFYDKNLSGSMCKIRKKDFGQKW